MTVVEDSLDKLVDIFEADERRAEVTVSALQPHEAKLLLRRAVQRLAELGERE